MAKEKLTEEGEDYNTQCDDIIWLMRKHPVNFILHIYHHKLTENFAFKISREINSTYSHAIIIINRLEEAGLIERINNEETKRTKFLKLTDKGKEVAKNLDKLRKVLKWEMKKDQ